jgi:hypothetical protein
MYNLFVVRLDAVNVTTVTTEKFSSGILELAADSLRLQENSETL